MTDYIIIALLAILVIENSRYGVSIMNWTVNQWRHLKHFSRRIFKK